jgi:hypothetical protein
VDAQAGRTGMSLKYTRYTPSPPWVSRGFDLICFLQFWAFPGFHRHKTSGYKSLRAFYR